jgi:hypothetical protein
MTIRNLDSSIRNISFYALLPVPPKMIEKIKNKDRLVRQATNSRVLHKIIRHHIDLVIGRSTKTSNKSASEDIRRMTDPIVYQAADGIVRQFHPRITYWSTNYEELTKLHLVINGYCPICEIPKRSIVSYMYKEVFFFFNLWFLNRLCGCSVR